MICVNCRAVDGRLDTVLAGDFGCAQTENLVPNAWWMVDLEIPRLITHVMITSCEFIGLSSSLRKTYGDRKHKPQTEANCEILIKRDFGRDVICFFLFS